MGVKIMLHYIHPNFSKYCILESLMSADLLIYILHANPHAGVIGITLLAEWMEPGDPDDPSSVEAADRAIQFQLGIHRTC